MTLFDYALRSLSSNFFIRRGQENHQRMTCAWAVASLLLCYCICLEDKKPLIHVWRLAQREGGLNDS